VWFVDLARLTDARLVPKVVATALGVKERADRPVLNGLADVLADSHLLVVLDNCEHLIQACAELVEYLLLECPELVVLATSREPLSVPGEHVWPLAPLSLPSARGSGDVVWTTTDVAGSEAVRLFVERVASVDPGFLLVATNAASVAEVCIRLDASRSPSSWPRRAPTCSALRKSRPSGRWFASACRWESYGATSAPHAPRGVGLELRLAGGR
jgi:predicted ATPase